MFQKSILHLLLAALLVTGTASAFSLSMTTTSSQSHESSRITTDISSRRTFGQQAALGIVAAGLGGGSGVTVVPPKIALAGDTDEADNNDDSDFVTTESGLKYKVTKEGTGAVPSAGATVQAHYTGWLDGFNSIKKFDVSNGVKSEDDDV